MESHPARQVFAQEMRNLEHDLIEMATRAEKMVSDAVASLHSLDTELPFEVMRADDEVDQFDLDIENRCLRLLALQQPMATDLREIGAIMKIITDVERIGDLSVDIAKVGLKIEKEMGTTSYVDIPKMGGVSQLMLRTAVEAFIKRDTSLLPKIAQMETQVDQLYRDLRGQIHSYMRNNPDQVISASWMLLAVHHIERIADHCLNIAERVGFMVTGHLEQLAEPHKPVGGPDAQ